MGTNYTLNHKLKRFSRSCHTGGEERAILARGHPGREETKAEVARNRLSWMLEPKEARRTQVPVLTVRERRQRGRGRPQSQGQEPARGFLRQRTWHRLGMLKTQRSGGVGEP